MDFKKKLGRKPTILMPAAVMVVLVIALVAVPAGAISRVTLQSAASKVLDSPSPAAIPGMINYQGYLTDASGKPMNGNQVMTFSIYNSASGGTAVWTETQAWVTVTNGLFNVLLGSINAINISHLTGESYLGVKVGADAEMTPRQRLVSVAYALRADMANNADTLDDLDSAAFVKKSGDTMTGALVLPSNGLVAGGSQLVLTSGKVGIGTTDPADYRLKVVGGSSDAIYASGNAYGLQGFASGILGKAVHGSNSMSGNYGTLGSSAEGVYGKHQASGNYGQLGTKNDGVAGYSNKDDGSGVYGENSAKGNGVYGYNQSSGTSGKLGTDVDGVAGYSNKGLGSGVYGENSSNGYGVFGFNKLHGTYGYLGGSIAYGKDGLAIGVYGYGPDAGSGQAHFGVMGESANGNYGILAAVPAGVYGYAVKGKFDFYAGGPGTNYGPFTGAHEVKLVAGFPQDFKPGLIVSVTGETQIRTNEGEMDFSSTLPTVQLSDTANDRKVLGALIAESPLSEDHWYQAAEEERFGIVNALGDGRVWVTSINGDIEAGDYITTSAIAGYGQKQDDDLLHSYTLGKATETINWSQVTETVHFKGKTYKAYPIAVVYTSG